MGAPAITFTTDYADDADKSQTDLKEFSEWTRKDQESRTPGMGDSFLDHLLFISFQAFFANSNTGNDGNETRIPGNFQMEGRPRRQIP
jgi:hypothetical protein